MNEPELTYGSYLHIEELLDLQQCQSPGPQHDELLFIVTHQVYELWFKIILHELDHLVVALRSADAGAALHTLRRVLVVFRTLVAQIEVLETMTPLQFLSFRSSLDSASGFQSAQFRELEFLLGLKRPAIAVVFADGSAERARLERRLHEPTVWDAVLHLLARGGYPVPSAELNRDVTRPPEPSPAVQRVLIDIYRHDVPLTQVCERLIDLDEIIQEWRYRHVKMVERTIGTKTGSGGSTGAGYLRGTLFSPLFPDLWAIRGEL